MTLTIRHLDFPVPTLRDLAVVLARRPRFWSRPALVALPATAIAALAGGWVAAIVVLPLAMLATAAADSRNRSIVRRWREARRRRAALNAPDRRDARRQALFDATTQALGDADQAWTAYLADALRGRTQSILQDRAAPNVRPLERLERVRAMAADLHIALDDPGQPPIAGYARLPVPPPGSFAPDTLSPPMMNLNAATLAQAKAEGAARAVRRRARMIEHAARFEPLAVFADRVVAATRADPPG